MVDAVVPLRGVVLDVALGGTEVSLVFPLWVRENVRKEAAEDGGRGSACVELEGCPLMAALRLAKEPLRGKDQLPPCPPRVFKEEDSPPLSTCILLDSPLVPDPDLP